MSIGPYCPKQVVTLTVTFAGDPGTNVFFSYQKPDNTIVTDPGFLNGATKIVKLSTGKYSYSIDTTGFSQGAVFWIFWGTGTNQAAAKGNFQMLGLDF